MTNCFEMQDPSPEYLNCPLAIYLYKGTIYSHSKQYLLTPVFSTLNFLQYKIRLSDKPNDHVIFMLTQINYQMCKRKSALQNRSCI